MIFLFFVGVLLLLVVFIVREFRARDGGTSNKGLAFVVGILMLLPGLCSILATQFTPWQLSANAGAMWRTGLLIGVGGIIVIYLAVKENGKP